MTKRNMTPKRRAAIFLAHGGLCHLCGGKIMAPQEKWEVEHIIALEISGDDSDGNLAPAHVKCHKAKTRQDAAVIAKCRRVREKHTGARKPKSRMAYRRFDGTIVYPDRRD